MRGVNEHGQYVLIELPPVVWPAAAQCQRCGEPVEDVLIACTARHVTVDATPDSGGSIVAERTITGGGLAGEYVEHEHWRVTWPRYAVHPTSCRASR